MDVSVYRLTVERIGRGTAAWSPDLLQLNLFSYDREDPLQDLVPVLRDILAGELGARVVVGVVPAGGTEAVEDPRGLAPGSGHLIVAMGERREGYGRARATAMP
jgi:hypothetical protein